jgi:soluble lytic murein transglycosylase
MTRTACWPIRTTTRFWRRPTSPGLNERFDGNVVLVSAGYNAGPRRASDWIERFGDPRDADADGIIYWIEAIPFTETRNYIMRVTESLAIYEAQLTGELPEIGLTDRLLR